MVAMDNKLWRLLYQKQNWKYNQQIVDQYLTSSSSTTAITTTTITIKQESPPHWIDRIKDDLDTERIMVQTPSTSARSDEDEDIVDEGGPSDLAPMLHYRMLERNPFFRSDKFRYIPIPAFKPPTPKEPHLLREQDHDVPWLNWRILYNTRHLLENRWSKRSFVTRALSGHTEAVYCVQFDEQKAVSGSRDASVKIWDLQRGVCLRTFRGHEGSVLCLQYDEKNLYTGGGDANIIEWDMQTGKKRLKFAAHNDSVLTIRMDPRILVTSSKDCSVRVWQREPLKLLRTLRGHAIAVNSVQFEGATAATASGDRSIRLWDLETGQQTRIIDRDQRGVACLDFDGKLIISGASDRLVKGNNHHLFCLIYLLN